MSEESKKYIIVKDRHPRISEVLNDCVKLCVPTYKNEPLSSILQKICAKIAALQTNTSPFSINLSDIDNFATATGSPAGDGDTLGYTLEIQPANYVFAGPLSGLDAIPTFRPLELSDLPELELQGDIINIVNNTINNVVYDTFDGTFLIDGGEISWVEDYTYLVSAGNYVILGDTYASLETQIILDPADGTFDRIDLVVLDTNGDVIVITGTPALNPQEPSFDPQTQIPLQFITVVAATTVDPCAVDTPIYTDNLGTGGGEWDAVSSSGTINVNSTNFPQTGTKDIEATNAAINATVTFTPAAPLSLSTYTQLNFYIRSKGTWIGNNPNNSKRLVVTFFNGATQVGNGVLILGTGNYGFNSATTGVYQQISIPKANFNITNETVTSLTMRVSGNQGTMGFYLDNVSLETNCNSTPPGPSAFTLNTLSTDTITLSATGSGTSSNPLTASLIVGATDNTEQNFMMWDGDSVELRTFASLGIISGITADQGLTANTSTNVQLGGTITNNRTITATSNSVIIDGTAGFGTLYAKTTTGTAFVAESTGLGTPILGMVANDIPYAIGTFKNTASTNTVLGVINVQRTTTGTAGDGIGGSIDFFNEISNGSSNISNQIISKWTTVDALTRTSQLILTGVNNIVTSDLFTLSGNGSLQLNEYGVGSFTTGTPIYNLSVTATGQVIETLPGAGGEIISADNGLTENVPGNVQLGGTLLQNTSISTGSFNLLLTTGTALANPLNVVATTGIAVQASVTTGNAVNGTATNGDALVGQSTNGVGLNAVSVNGIGIISLSNNNYSAALSVFPASTNTVTGVLNVIRQTSGTPANGIGGSIDFNVQSTGGNEIANQIISKWTDATLATRTSQFILTGVNSAVTGDILTLNGNKSIQANGYGAGAFTGTATFNLAVDASGNVIEVAAGGGGGANTALSNLAAVAINTSLISDTNNTDDLGSAAIAWKDIYSYTNKFIGSTSGTITLVAPAVAGTNTITFPATTGTISTLNGTQTWTGVNTFSSRVDITAGFRTAGTTSAANLAAVSGSGLSASEVGAEWQVEGSASMAYRVGSRGSTNATIPVNNAYGSFISGQMSITEAASGNHPLVAGMVLRAPSITGGVATVSNTATLYIDAAPSTTVSDQNSALWVASGNVRLGKAGTAIGTISLEGNTSGAVTITPQATAGTATLTLPTVTGTIVQYVEGTTASSATPTPTGDARENYYDVTALAVNATFGAPTGTPANHNGLLIRIKDDGTARTLAFNAIYRGGGDIALPTTTVLGKVMYLQFTYNSQDSFWDLVGLTNNI